MHLEYPWDDGFIHKKDVHYFLAELINDERVDLIQSEQEETSTVKVEWLTLTQAEKDFKFNDEREIVRKVIQVLNVKL